MITSGINIEVRDLVAGYTKGRNRFQLPVVTAAKALPGELVVIIGPNGSGKSTLLRTIAGIQKPVSGEILYGEHKIRSIDKSFLSRILGYVSTEQIHVSGMTVRDLVALGRYPYTNWIGRESDIDQLSVNLAIEKAGIIPLASRYFEELSDGERQRAMIARVLAQDPPIMVLDEPSAFLDISNRYEIVELLRHITIKENKTVIFSTHDVHHALPRADRVWLISESGLIEGAPEDLMVNGLLAKAFPSIKDPASLYGTGKADSKLSGDPIVVTGSASDVKWTLQALNRKGIRDVNGKAKDISVDIQRDSKGTIWRVSGSTGTEIYSSILDFLGSPLLADLM